uniref:Uncharacterized protein n=1 Tax=uncultured prokaryote TaxID=198431 RepID=H5SPZ8_9ZZZZ|nr:hypothetical protein HGMM_F55D02C34 [uncultured prokaryote]
MKIEGDPKGIEVLKKLKEKNVQFLKFLLHEAKTNTDLKAKFSGSEGDKYIIKYVPSQDVFIVEKED